MSREDVIRLREKLNEVMERLEDERDGVLRRIKRLHRRCKHPNLRTYSAMGEPGTVCDDCGYQT